ncbi:MAG: hypothetical protein AAGC84_07180 [Pseudomonas sp.]
MFKKSAFAIGLVAMASSMASYADKVEWRDGGARVDSIVVSDGPRSGTAYLSTSSTVSIGSIKQTADDVAQLQRQVDDLSRENEQLKSRLSSLESKVK